MAQVQGHVGEAAFFAVERKAIFEGHPRQQRAQVRKALPVLYAALAAELHIFQPRQHGKLFRRRFTFRNTHAAHVIAACAGVQHLPVRHGNGVVALHLGVRLHPRHDLRLIRAPAEIGRAQQRKLAEKCRLSGGQRHAQLACVGADASVGEVDLRHVFGGFFSARRSCRSRCPSPAARGKAQARKQSAQQ